MDTRDDPKRGRILTGLLVGAVVFAGAFGGTWLAQSILQRDARAQAEQMKDRQRIAELDADHVSFSVGDLFPLETYRDSSGTTHNFEEIVVGRGPSLLIFLKPGCPPCSDLLNHWSESAETWANRDVQIVWCLESEHLGELPLAYDRYLSESLVAYYDRELWRGHYQMTHFPVLIAVDIYGFVSHIQFGFDGSIDTSLLAGTTD